MRRCVYCGNRCHGRACVMHCYLTKIELGMYGQDQFRDLAPLRVELREAVKAAREKGA